MRDGVVDHLHDAVLDILALENLKTLRIDDLALRIENVVVFQNVLARRKVAGLDLFLGALDRAGQGIFWSIGSFSSMPSVSIMF